MLEPLFNKVSGLQGKDLQALWKKTLTQVLSCEYYEIFKSTYFEERLRTTVSVNRQTGKSKDQLSFLQESIYSKHL